MEKETLRQTRDQRALLQQDQIADMRMQQSAESRGDIKIETIPGNRNPKYKIKVRESEDYVHVFTRNKHLSNDQKDFTFEDRVLPIHARDFDRKVIEGIFFTFDEVEVVHDPRKDVSDVYDLQPNKPKTAKQSAAGKVHSENVAAREKDLAAKEELLDNRIADINSKFDSLSELGTKLEERNQLLTASEQETLAKQTTLDNALRDAEQRSKYAEARETEIKRRAQEVSDAADKLAKDQAEFKAQVEAASKVPPVDQGGPGESPKGPKGK